MRGYTQLTEAERYQISVLLKAGLKKTTIASLLGRHKSTISREIARNCGRRGYRPNQAQRFANACRQKKVHPRLANTTWVWVKLLLKDDWSPEQISGWLITEKKLHISHEWIYQFVYQDKRNGGTLHEHLRCQKVRKKRYGSNDRRGQIKDRVSIDQRPAIVDQRSRIGDWEADTVIGKPGGTVLVTLAERKTRYSVIALASNKTAQAVTESLVASLKPHSCYVHTLTYDNGKEFAYHEAISTALQAKGFFAHPYHSWERDLNENTNGLIRQYLPKGSNFKSLTVKNIQKIMDKLNNRPRKCLGFKTPNQLFFGINPKVALGS